MNVKKKMIGKVTPQERNEIQELYECRNSLKELLIIVNSDTTALYNRIMADMAETQRKFDAWWNNHAKKYEWETVENGNWEIDFQTCEIFLSKVVS